MCAVLATANPAQSISARPGYVLRRKVDGYVGATPEPHRHPERSARGARRLHAGSAGAGVPTEPEAGRASGAPARPAAGRSAAAPTAAEAAPSDEGVASFYRGKTVRIVVGFPPGGGYDTYARAIARHLGQYVPGNPTVIVDNMPGAGSLVAANNVYNAAPKDGTVIVLFSGAAVGQQLFGAPEIRFDATRFDYLGVPVGDTAVVHLHQRAGVTSFEQLVGPNAKEIVLGGSAAGSLNVDAATLLRDVLGANIKLVTGYPGSAPIRAGHRSGRAGRQHRRLGVDQDH